MNSKLHAKVDDFTSSLATYERELEAFTRWCLDGEKFNDHDVEDVISDAYFRAIKRLHEDPNLQIQDYKKWFFKFLYFTSLKRNRRRDWSLSEDDLLDLEDESFALDSIRSRRQMLGEAFENLDEDASEILTLYMDGFTASEIAEQRNATADAVRKAKSRAIAALRETIRGSGL